MKQIIHLPPISPLYRGGFVTITECQGCQAIGSYYDAHPANACHLCGGGVLGSGAGKWIPPVKSGWLWWKRVVTPGYWKRSQGEQK